MAISGLNECFADKSSKDYIFTQKYKHSPKLLYAWKTIFFPHTLIYRDRMTELSLPQWPILLELMSGNKGVIEKTVISSAKCLTTIPSKSHYNRHFVNSDIQMIDILREIFYYNMIAQVY